MKLECQECGVELTSTTTGAYREIRGWEHIRAKGGANAIVLRKETGMLMCAGCMERRKLNERMGITPDQMGMNL